MKVTPNIGRDKRLQIPKNIFSPSMASQSLLSNYLIYMPDTMSYSIVGKSSIKNIQGKKATLIVNKNKFIGDIIFAGNFARCQAELSKIQQKSQSLENNELIELDEDENEAHDYDLIEKDDDNNVVEEEPSNVFDESEDDLSWNQDFGTKRKRPRSHALVNESRPAKRSKQGRSNEIDQDSQGEADTQLETTNNNQHLSTTDTSLRSIENKITDLSKNMVKISHAMRHIASSSGQTGSHNLDHYRDSNIQENFSNKVDYGGQNLVDVVGKDFGDFARQVMRILYTEEELKTCVLPPKRPHLTREPLDLERFRLLNEAVQMKYRLTSYLYGDFYKYHLRPKLSDFLIEERRRKDTKNTRKQATAAIGNITTERPTTD